MADLDVVIVNWNAGDKLFECLESVQHSRAHPSFHLSKCIVVDNASSDDSLSRVASLDLPLELLRNHENKGFGAACNQGAHCGSSPYILFLNPDVRLYPESLPGALSFLESDSAKSIGILGIQMVDQTGRVHRNVARFPTRASLLYSMLGMDRLLPRRFPPHFMTDWAHRERRVVDQVPGSFFLMRRPLFEQLHGFDERFFMYYEDLDLAYRAHLAGWKSYYLADVQAFHYGGGTTHQIKARRLFYVLRSRVIYAAKHFGYFHALMVVALSLLVEGWVRLARDLLLHRSVRNAVETVQAYFLYITGLPSLLGNIKG